MPFSGTGKHIVTGLQPNTMFEVRQGGTLIAQRVSSTAGVVSFDSTNGGTFAITQPEAFVDGSGYGPYHKFVALRAPADGETLLNPVGLRLFATVGDGEAPSIKCEFYVDSTLVATVTGASNGNYEYYTFVTGLSLSAGDHTIWAKSYHVPDAANPGGVVLVSAVRRLTVVARPTYGSTVDLTSDLVVSGGTTYVGTAGSRILIEGHNLRSASGSPTNIDFRYVDFVGVTNFNFTTTGTIRIENCRFFECGTLNVTQNGSGTAAVKANHFASNSRFLLYQLPEKQGTAFCTDWNGTSSGLKVFESNNTGAGSHHFNTANWTIGGSTVAKGNISIGPRIGFWFDYGANGTWSFQRNYSYHDYPSTFSQGSNLELGASNGSIAPAIIEHNVIGGGSWPVRFLSGEFRYNLVHGVGVEGPLWTGPGTGANIHHNVIYMPYVSRGVVYQAYGGPTTAVRNNTFHVPFGYPGVAPNTSRLYVEVGTMDLKANCFYGEFDPTVATVVNGGGVLTANYNNFYGSTAPHYSPVLSPANDVTGNPGFASPFPYMALQWSHDAVWNRAVTVADILSTTRARYTPSALVIDTGDTTTFGAGNDIGAVGAGTANASDLFGVGV
jgi:hypothetical protein